MVLDSGVIDRALPLLKRFSDSSAGNVELAEQLQQLKLWIEAVQQENLTQTQALAGDNEIKQLVLVQMALKQNNGAQAATYLAKFSTQREDYWRLKAQLATMQKSPRAAEAAKAELANLQARALAVVDA